MKEIWYLLRCPKGDETEYIKRFSQFINHEELKEVICFRYQRMMRYAGAWHVEKRILLPGCIFLSGKDVTALGQRRREDDRAVDKISLTPWESPFLKEMCQEGNLIHMSRGIIRDRKVEISEGPLKGREGLIRKIDRHKRLADIEVPFGDKKKQVTVGLEIYEKQM